MTERDEAALLAYYALGREHERLSVDARGVLEFERSVEIIARALPNPPAVIADVGGGPGRYALWLAERGYQVEHRDLVPLHVEQLTAGRPVGAAIRTGIADARDLDLADQSVDAALLLGPLYHLRRRADRLSALREVRRILRPGGAVFAAAISRWAPRLDGELRAKMYEEYPLVGEHKDATRFPGSRAGNDERRDGLEAVGATDEASGGRGSGRGADEHP